MSFCGVVAITVTFPTLIVVSIVYFALHLVIKV
jgi:hypothetical protein